MWAEHRHRQLLPSITCLLPSSCPNQGLWSLPSPLGSEHDGDEQDPCSSICVQRAQPKEGVSVYDDFHSKFQCKKSRKGHLRGHLHPRGGMASTSHAQEPAFQVSTSPHIPESKDKQHHKQRLTFLLDSFPPPPKAIWCFVYRESCHGEPACKAASTTACIKLANSWPKEPKTPESQKIRALWCGVALPTWRALSPGAEGAMW